MKKTIITLTGAAFLGMLGTTVTPAPASAFIQLFFVPGLMAKYDPNFKAVNPYEKKVAVRHKKMMKKK